MADGTQILPRVAANGLLDRRLFMRTLVLSTVATAGSSFAEPVGKGQPEWMLTPGATTED